ncbi:hypothetical protein [Micromonospora sp. KC213]|uniref:hypothetical protein n=1 Tax=Micromonospora sp. KC213 TaxID=2530378 RepID=UPI001048C7B8|nr:hypothetical protein [Micromonospora sp. KC213]TDC43789.1 hypothetical protein E1166_01965 [Micromonospora sp. KC213]
MGRTEVEPRVFVRATDYWIELSARFVLPVREVRAIKDAVTRTILDRPGEAGIPVTSATQEVTLRNADGVHCAYRESGITRRPW